MKPIVHISLTIDQSYATISAINALIVRTNSEKNIKTLRNARENIWSGIERAEKRNKK